jgi:hypothetical protein
LNIGEGGCRETEEERSSREEVFHTRIPANSF